MNTCPKCDAERVYAGAMFPVRALCQCETGRFCHECGRPARIVEFQDDFVEDEPELPGMSKSKIALFYCEKHAPMGFDSTDLPQIEVVELADLEYTANVDPDWPLNARPPTGAISRELILCECLRVHKMCDRINWNGTESECPSCGSEMTLGEPYPEDIIRSKQINAAA